VIFLDEYGALASATIYTSLLFVIVFIQPSRYVKEIRQRDQVALAKRQRCVTPGILE
jgi:hypothetical protein